MDGGDLNMKKSWRPYLIKNRVGGWREERKTLAEKKEFDQLRKELEEERQQRLQEAQTGKKKVETLEMYTTPATGGGPSTSELEDYLLGKKHIDQMPTGDEAAKVGTSHRNFVAVQNTNTDRDTAANPMFAIQRREQAEYTAYMSGPLRLRPMKERTESVDDKAKYKEKRKRLKEKKKERRYLPIRGMNAPRPQSDNGRLEGHSVSMTHFVVLDMTPHRAAALMTPCDGTITLTTLLPTAGLVLLSDTEEVVVGVAAVTVDSRGRPIIPPVELPHLVSE
ncbi:RNA-splicing factor [Ceratobasidium sp. 392]|nr:RNA-splicing factor [Ceratobasidium sp. 392]